MNFTVDHEQGRQLHGLARLTRQAVHLDDVSHGNLSLPAAGTDDRVHRGSPR